MRRLNAKIERFDLHSHFSISRSKSNHIDVVTVVIEQEGITGWGECRPYARYGKTPESVLQEIEIARILVEGRGSGEELLEIMPAGAARNAVDCALWDLEAKLKGRSVWQMIGGQGDLKPASSVQSLSIDTPENMAIKAQSHKEFDTLKVKLAGDDEDLKRLKAIKGARPDARLVVDANEGWSFDGLKRFVAAAQDLNVFMIEQPLKKEEDAQLVGYDSGNIILCGDESIHTLEDIEDKIDVYGMMNIKLDKAGGLTHALQMVEGLKALNKGRAKRVQLMIGCMVCTSLAIAPHILLAQNCDLADLDGSSWLSQDRDNGAIFKDGFISAGSLWGNL